MVVLRAIPPAACIAAIAAAAAPSSAAITSAAPEESVLSDRHHGGRFVLPVKISPPLQLSRLDPAGAEHFNFAVFAIRAYHPQSSIDLRCSLF